MNNKSLGDTASIPLVDLRVAHVEVADEIRSGFDRILTNTAFIKGAEVDAFEREYAAFAGISHCVGVANGTDAIELALRAVGVADGGEVILPANTFVATAEAVMRAGARPVFADVDREYLLLDDRSLLSAIGPDTAAVIPVHLYGQLAPMRQITATVTARDLPIIEDAAQAHGAAHEGLQAGSFGAMAAMSFYPGKNLGAYGDAGAVLTNEADLARKVRLLGDHGSERRYEHMTLGFNSRMDALQAVVLRAKLRKLNDWNKAREQAANRYEELMADLDEVVLPKTAPGNVHVWHLYVIRVPHRDHVLKYLEDSGVRAAIHYPVPVHLQPAFRGLGYGPGDFPVAEAAANEILSLPLYPHITAEQQQRVADVVRKALTAQNRG